MLRWNLFVVEMPCIVERGHDCFDRDQPQKKKTKKKISSFVTMSTATNPYHVLGLEFGATPQEIKKAHKKLALK